MSLFEFPVYFWLKICAVALNGHPSSIRESGITGSIAIVFFWHSVWLVFLFYICIVLVNNDIDTKFTANYDALEETIKSNTIGLVTLEQMRDQQKNAVHVRYGFARFCVIFPCKVHESCNIGIKNSSK